MNGFKYCLPANILFGTGSVKNVGEETKKYGSSVLLVTGTGSTKRTGLLDTVVELLRESGLEVVVFDKVTQNPLTDTAIEGALLAKEKSCDVVIGLGGGSILDCSKAIAFMAVNDGDINDYIFGTIQSDKALPVIAIPTTCGTGSEGNGFAVLTNPITQDKKSLRGEFLIPKLSIVDPLLMKTMPKHIFAQVSFDALCHLMEASTSRSTNIFAKTLALKGVELIMQNVVAIYNGDDSNERYEAVTLASTIGGMAIYCAGVALPHAMEHPVSGLKNAVHGKGLAALTPTILAKTIEKDSSVYDELAIALGGKSSGDCVSIVKKLLEDLSLTCSLRNFDIVESDIDWLVTNCYKVSGVSVKNHPVLFSEEELRIIYCDCL